MRSTKLIILIVGILIIPIAALMFSVNWTNYNPASGLTQIDDTIQRTVSIVIGMIPSGMLLLTSIALTLGIIRLMAHNTLVQDLYSLEGLARVNVLCLDKTGTITDGRMKVQDCMLLSNPTDFSVTRSSAPALRPARQQPDFHRPVQLFRTQHNADGKRNHPFSSKKSSPRSPLPRSAPSPSAHPNLFCPPYPKRSARSSINMRPWGARTVGCTFGRQDHRRQTARILQTHGDRLDRRQHRDDAAQTIRWFKENDVAVKVISGDNPITVSEVANAWVWQTQKNISLWKVSTRKRSSPSPINTPYSDG